MAAVYSGICPTCQQPFTSRIKKKRFCSHECYTKSDFFREVIAASCRTRGCAVGERVKFVCEKCQKEFEMHPHKVGSAGRSNRFCSVECYRSSPAIRDHLASMRKHSPTIELICAMCEVPFTVKQYDAKRKDKKKNRKFCSMACRREFFAERFDRWVASPEAIPLPQNYDEFLTLEELPCLVPGCDWIGQHLGMHVNHAHGITAAEFKELAGFNRHSALVTPSVHETLAAAQKGNDSLEGQPLPPPGGKFERRREHIEHLKKVWALKRIEGTASRRSG